MLPRRVTVPLLAFLVLSGGVIANVFLLQSGGRTGRGIDATAWNIAAIEAAEFGDTGSIGNSPDPRHPDNGLDLSAIEAAPKAGDADNVAKAIQRELQIRGYATGAQDGVVGTMTQAAIMAFEHDHGMPLTGRPSDDLLKAIVLGSDGKPAKGAVKVETSEAQDVIRTVQRSLAKLGYKPGAVTGKMTAETTRAIRAFEADQALPESGRVSGPLVARLGRLAGTGRVAAAP